MAGSTGEPSPGTVDQWPKNLSSHLMYGGWWTFPVPDIEAVISGEDPADPLTAGQPSVHLEGLELERAYEEANAARKGAFSAIDAALAADDETEEES